MRTLALASFAAPSLLLLAASLAACEDSSGGAGAGGQFESEAGAFEAGPISDSSTAVDGSMPDVAVPEAGVGVSVSVIGNAGPKAGVRVILHDATGTVTGEIKTDAAGKASTPTAPSMITVLYAQSASYATPVTFMGVADGDQLLVTPDEEVNDVQLGNYAVTFTVNPAVATANYFTVGMNAGGCGSNGNAGQTVNVPVFKSCSKAANTLLSTAFAPTATAGYAFAKNIAPPAGGATVTVPLGAYVAPGSRTVKATNMPAGEISKQASVYGIVGNDLFYFSTTSEGSVDDTGVVAATAQGFAEAYEVEVDAATYLNGVQSQTSLYHREAATADVTATFPTVDFSAALPFVTGADVSTAGAGGSARPQVTLRIATAPTAKAFATRMNWNGETTGGSWIFVGPGNLATFTAPALPADAGAFVPHDSIYVNTGGYADGTFSFGDLKKLPVSPGAYRPTLIDPIAPVPAGATLKVSTFGLSEG